MKELFLLGLVGLSGYLLYENYNLRKTLTANAAAVVTPAAVAATVQPVATANMVTSQQEEIVPSVMYESYDAEHFSKFPWK